MKKRMIIRIVIAIVLCMVVGVSIDFTMQNYDIGSYTEYECNVKNLHLTKIIKIDKENQDFAEVYTQILQLFTNAFTMYDTEGNRIAYTEGMDSIYVEDMIMLKMEKRHSIFGNSYDIYRKEEKISSVTFDVFNKNGQMYDTKGNLVADFHSRFLGNGFYVRISDECAINEKAILMIFCVNHS